MTRRLFFAAFFVWVVSCGKNSQNSAVLAPVPKAPNLEKRANNLVEKYKGNFVLKSSIAKNLTRPQLSDCGEAMTLSALFTGYLIVVNTQCA